MTDHAATDGQPLCRGPAGVALLTAVVLAIGVFSAPCAAAHPGTHGLQAPATSDAEANSDSGLFLSASGEDAKPTEGGPYIALGKPNLGGVGYLAVQETFIGLLKHVQEDDRSPNELRMFNVAGQRLDVTTGRPVPTPTSAADAADAATISKSIRTRFSAVADKLRKGGCTSTEVSILVFPKTSAKRTAERSLQVLAALEEPDSAKSRRPILVDATEPKLIKPPADDGAVDVTALRNCLSRLTPIGSHKAGYLHNVWHRIVGS